MIFCFASVFELTQKYIFLYFIHKIKVIQYTYIYLTDYWMWNWRDFRQTDELVVQETVLLDQLHVLLPCKSKETKQFPRLLLLKKTCFIHNFFLLKNWIKHKQLKLAINNDVLRLNVVAQLNIEKNSNVVTYCIVLWLLFHWIYCDEYHSRLV